MPIKEYPKDNSIRQAEISLTQKIIARGFLAIGLRGLATLASLALTILVARNLGVAPAGEFYLALSTAMFGAVIAARGIDSAAMALLSQELVQGTEGVARSMIGRAQWVALTRGFWGAAVTYAVIFLLFRYGQFWNDSQQSALVYGALLIAALVLLNTQSSLLQAQKRPNHAIIVQYLLPPVLTIVILLFARDELSRMSKPG